MVPWHQEKADSYKWHNIIKFIELKIKNKGKKTPNAHKKRVYLIWQIKYLNSLHSL